MVPTYESSAEFILTRTIPEILRRAINALKREHTEKDKVIASQNEQLETKEMYIRNIQEDYRNLEQHSRELNSELNHLRHTVAMLTAEKNALLGENDRLEHETSASEQEKCQLQADLDKANQIIKSMVKKIQINTPPRLK